MFRILASGCWGATALTLGSVLAGMWFDPQLSQNGWVVVGGPPVGYFLGLATEMLRRTVRGRDTVGAADTASERAISRPVP